MINRSCTVMCSGTIIGSISNAETTLPTSTAGIRSTLVPAFLSTMTFTDAANGTPSAIVMPISCAGATWVRLRANIQIMPSSATAIASHVRAVMCSRRNAHASIAVSNGETLITISVLATVVIANAIMKQQNIAAHINPESRPRQPNARTLSSAWEPLVQSRTAATNSAANRLRQNVTSNPLARCRWRVSTPALLHKVAAATIINTALRCGSTFMRTILK